jgi:hypothetical protein
MALIRSHDPFSGHQADALEVPVVEAVPTVEQDTITGNPTVADTIEVPPTPVVETPTPRARKRQPRRRRATKAEADALAARIDQ